MTIQEYLDIHHNGNWASIESEKTFRRVRRIATLEQYRDALYKYMNEPTHFIGEMNLSCTLTIGSYVMEIPTKVYIGVVYQYLQDEIKKMYGELEDEK